MGRIARWIEMRRIKRESGLYISKQMIKKASADLGKPTFKPCDLSFILVEFQDAQPEQAARNILQLRRIAFEHNGTPWGFISSIGLIAFGDIFEASAEARAAQTKECVDALIGAFKENIKLVYGQSSAVLAHVLEDMNSHFGPIIPGLPLAMIQLSALTFGSVAEVKPPTAAP